MAPKARAKSRGVSRSPSPARRLAPDRAKDTASEAPEEAPEAKAAEAVLPHPDTIDSAVKGAEPATPIVEAASWQAEMEDKMVDVFRRFDLNGNGFVEVSEMKRVLQKIDPDAWSDDKIDLLFSVSDLARDSSIKYEQFLKWILSGRIASEHLLASDDTSLWKDLGEEFETVTWQPIEGAELSENGQCVVIPGKGRISCLTSTLIPPVGACSWTWRIKSSPTDTRRSFLDVGILLDGGDIASNAIYARLAPPGDVAAELDMETGLFKMYGVGDSGPTCDFLLREEKDDFLLNGVGTLCGQLWRPFIYCFSAAGISIDLVDYQVSGRAVPLLRTGISAGRGDAASKALLRKWLPGSGGQPGPGIGDIQCILPRAREPGLGALYICAAAAVTEQNLKLVNVSALVRLGHSFKDRSVPGGIEAKVIGIDDNAGENFAVHIDDSNAFIDGHIQNGRSVLVHCGAGVSRSGAAAVAYVMMAERLSYDRALALVKKARSWVRPNDGFQKQLKDYQRRLETSGHY